MLSRFSLRRKRSLAGREIGGAGSGAKGEVDVVRRAMWQREEVPPEEKEGTTPLFLFRSTSTNEGRLCVCVSVRGGERENDTLALFLFCLLPVYGEIPVAVPPGDAREGPGEGGRDKARKGRGKGEQTAEKEREREKEREKQESTGKTKEDPGKQEVSAVKKGSDAYSDEEEEEQARRSDPWL